MSGDPALVRVMDAGFRYAEREVLRGVSLVVERGSMAALVGPNGAGKTTLLRMVGGGLTPSRGTILLDGATPASYSRAQRARKVALVPQQLEVPFDFTVEQIVEQGRTPYLPMLRGLVREDRAAVERALGLVDATGLRGRVYNELSGGERQRVKVAVGLAQEPELLLMDEPTQNLDIGRQAELLDLLHALRKDGLTILASIHDLHLIEGNFDTVHLLEPDFTLRSGTPGEMLTAGNLARAFRCSPGRHPLLRI